MRGVIAADSPLPPANGTSDMPHGLLFRFLADPDAFYAEVWRTIWEFLAAWWPVATPSCVAFFCVIVGTRLVVRSKQRILMAADARVVEVQVPPSVNPAAAEAFWAHLHALLRPTWRRIWSGQPASGVRVLLRSTGGVVQDLGSRRTAVHDGRSGDR